MKKLVFLFFILLQLLIIHSTVIHAQEDRSGSILMVLDVQEHFLEHAMQPDEANRLINEVNEIIEMSRPMDIVFIQANIRVLSVSLKGIKAEPVENQKLAGALYRKKNDPVFVKSKPSAFSAGDFSDYLEENHIGRIFMVGIFAGDCVTATALDGLERGFEMVLIREGIVDKKSDRTRSALAKLEKRGVKVIGKRD